ncbi:unnamed protein product [Rhizopus microsporus]
MTELDTIKFPMTVNEIPVNFGYVNKSSILGIFNNNVQSIQPSQADQGEVRQSMQSLLMRGLKIGKNDV